MYEADFEIISDESSASLKSLLRKKIATNYTLKFIYFYYNSYFETIKIITVTLQFNSISDNKKELEEGEY